MLFQTSDTTWQAYNTYGGNSLYTGDAGYAGAARTRSATTGRSSTAPNDARRTSFFTAECPMVRFLERNGYDVSYSAASTPTAAARCCRTTRCSCRRATTSTGRARSAPTSRPARDAGVNLAFFTGNAMYWKTRYEPSIDGTATPYRTLVSYKETHAERDDRSATADVDRHLARPTLQPARRRRPARERADRHDLHGQLLTTRRDHGARRPTARLRIWRNTSVATLAPGRPTTLADRLARLRVGRRPRQRLPSGRA